ncbi:hypothetical protein [Streptomyces canus]|uniref:hypothetical protein n=1 Tax=Streptomyces canus TaxID=58343 RepID=UPI002E360DC3|nr:hypothetical protein [Streptomyces canus]
MAEYRRSTSTAFSVLAIISAILMTSCSSGEETRAYAVPDKVCGVSITPTLVRPLLPPGKSIDAGASLTGPDDTQRCEVMIEDDAAVKITGQRYPDTLGVKEVALNYLGVPADELGQANSDNSVMVWDSRIVGVTKCANYPTDAAGRSTKRYSVTIEASYPDDAKVRREALERLLPQYLAAAAHALGC